MLVIEEYYELQEMAWVTQDLEKESVMVFEAVTVWKENISSWKIASLDIKIYLVWTSYNL